MVLPAALKDSAGAETAAQAAAKSNWQLERTVRPRFTRSPQTGHSRPLGLVMSQISESTMKPKNQMNQRATTPIPVPASDPASQALR